MRARPKIEDYKTKDNESNQDAIFFSRLMDDWEQWAGEAEQEIKELRELLDRVKTVGFSIEISKQIAEALKKEK